MAILVEELVTASPAPRVVVRAPASAAWVQWGLPLLIVALVALLTARHIDDGGFRSTDEARHAMNGLFLLDMVRDGGWRSPREYGEQYYARYPCLSIPYNHPPFFHAVEAAMFAIAGESAATARWTVLLFHVASCWLLYRLVLRLDDWPTAALAVTLFATAPVVMIHSQRVFLEAPQVCLMLLATCLAARYADRPRRGAAALYLAVIAAAMLTKPTSAIALPAHAALIWSLHGRDGHRLPAARWIVLLTVLGLAVVTALVVRHAGFQLRVVTHGDWSSRFSLAHLLQYPRLLPQHVGWPLVLAAVVGVVSSWRDPAHRRSGWLWSAWAAAFWLLMVALNTHGVSRYLFLWAPPLAALGAMGLMAVARGVGSGWLAGLALAAFFAPVAVQATEVKTALFDGMESAARVVAAHPGGAAVLIDAEWDGDFIFYSRLLDPERRLVLRGSKVLYTFASYKSIGFREYADEEAEILDVLRKYGVHYVVVENFDEHNTVSGARLRQLTRGEQFELVESIPLVDTLGSLGSTRILVYRFREAPECTAETIELQFPGLHQAIQVPLTKATAWRSKK